jgi:hypothetical protein
MKTKHKHKAKTLDQVMLPAIKASVDLVKRIQAEQDKAKQEGRKVQINFPSPLM